MNVDGEIGTSALDGGARPRALFVLGAPRSGTTLICSYLGSSEGAVDLGEYGAFHLAYNAAQPVMGAMPGPFREAYLADLTRHAREFAEGLARDHRCVWYCDGTPWNICCAKRLRADFPDSVFVLMLRHYSGTIQSLRRLYAVGSQWAGANWAESAEIWKRCYAYAPGLPPDRTVPVSYDALSRDPGPTLAHLRLRLAEHGFDASTADPRVLTASHAQRPGQSRRPTIATLGTGGVEFHPRPSFDPDSWSGDIQKMVWPVVRDVHHTLKHGYAAIYRSPPPPRKLLHHDVEGLVETGLDEEW